METLLCPGGLTFKDLACSRPYGELGGAEASISPSVCYSDHLVGMILFLMPLSTSTLSEV